MTYKILSNSLPVRDLEQNQALWEVGRAPAGGGLQLDLEGNWRVLAEEAVQHDPGPISQGLSQRSLDAEYRLIPTFIRPFIYSLRLQRIVGQCRQRSKTLLCLFLVK